MKKIIATISVDDDRWAKWPYSLEFDDEECNSKYGVSYAKKRTDCEKAIKLAREAGYEIEVIEKHF